MKKVIICGNCIEDLDTFNDLFENGGLVFEKIDKDGLVLYDKICKSRPDVVVCEAFMPGKDALSLLKDMKLLNISTKFVPVLPAGNEFLERELVNNGASYYFIKPFDYKTLALIVNDLCNCNSLSYRTNGRTQALIEEEVSNILHEIGIPANIKGYQYLRYAVVLCVNDIDNINHVTKKLYPRISDKFNTTPSRVERAMRHSIEVAWQRGDIEVLDTYFKNTIGLKKGKPSNSEFIAMVAETVKIKRGKRLGKIKRFSIS